MPTERRNNPTSNRVVVVESIDRWEALKHAPGIVHGADAETLIDTVSGIVYRTPAKAWQFD